MKSQELYVVAIITSILQLTKQKFREGGRKRNNLDKFT
jgi:hypothetical protein